MTKKKKKINAKNCLYIQTSEILERREFPANDVPPEEVLEAFRQDFPAPPLPEDIDPETFIDPLEGLNLKLTDATHIVGDGTNYDIEHVSKMLRSMTPEERLALSPSPKMMPFIADVYMIPEDKKPED